MILRNDIFHSTLVNNMGYIDHNFCESFIIPISNIQSITSTSNDDMNLLNNELINQSKLIIKGHEIQ